MITDMLTYLNDQQPALDLYLGYFVFGLKVGCLLPLAFVVALNYRLPIPASWLELLRSWLVGYIAAFMVFWPKTGVSIYDVATTVIAVVVAVLLVGAEVRVDAMPTKSPY